MENRITELLESENIEDNKLGIVLAAKTNYPIKKLNAWFGETYNSQDYKEVLEEYTDTIWFSKGETLGKYINGNYKFFTKYK